MAKGPDFSKRTAETLAKRAAQWCSNPDCNNKTSGPHSAQEKAVNLGEAAHIKGARPGSARYDPSMTDEQRSDIANGLWLCKECATKIDRDEERFPVKLLLIWKEYHENLVQIKGVKTDSDFRVREELLRLQRENVELGQQLKAKNDWEHRESQYQLVQTDGGAVVYLFLDNPQHYACQSCFEKKSIQILQDRNSWDGTFECPGCKTRFPIKPQRFYLPVSVDRR